MLYMIRFIFKEARSFVTTPKKNQLLDFLETLQIY